MADDSKKQILIGVAIAVIGSLLLATFEPIRSFIGGLLVEGWRLFLVALATSWSYLTHDQKVNGFLLVVSLLALLLVFILFIAISITALKGKAYKDYVEDSFHGVNWRWRWGRSGVENLWCFCPKCDFELAYDDSSTHQFSHDSNPRTDLVCDHCRRVVGSVNGSTKDYLLSIVEREIKRKVRNNLHDKPGA